MRPILTTHVGSLPRGNELVPLLLARDHGRPYDAEAFDRLVQAGILRGDSHDDIQREAFWKSAPPGKGCVVIDVFELIP